MHRIAIIVGIALLHTGCATLPDRQQTTGQSAGLGAVFGAVTGAVIGNQSGDAAQGALIGGLAGAAAGALYGNHVANKKEEFANQEDYLDACLAQAESVRVETAKKNATLLAEIAALDEQVEAYAARQAEEEANLDEAQQIKQQLAASIDTTESTLNTVQDEIRVQQDVRTQEEPSAGEEKLAALDEQIRLLEEQKLELTEQAQHLASLSSRMSV